MGRNDFSIWFQSAVCIGTALTVFTYEFINMSNHQEKYHIEPVIKMQITPNHSSFYGLSEGTTPSSVIP